MTSTEIRHASPVECMPWCESGDGHPDEITYADQNCYSAADYLSLPLNRRRRERGGDDPVAQISVTAKREVTFLPCVHVHLMMADPDVDVGVKFTPAEARWAARELLKIADLAEGGLGHDGRD